MAHTVVDDDNVVSQQVLLRINAANLPRHGILQGLPDSYAVVSSVSVPNGQDGVNFDLSQTYVNNSLNGSNSHGQTKIEWGKTEMYVGTQYTNDNRIWISGNAHLLDLLFVFGFNKFVSLPYVFCV